MRKIWIAILLLIFLVPVAVVAAVNADHETHESPANGSGTISFTPNGIISGPTERGEHANVTVVKESLSFTGNLTGTAHTVERQVSHNDTDDRDDGPSGTFTTFRGQGNFTGTLNGASVTLRIRYEGFRNTTFTRGNFVVSGNTTQNVDVHAEGHFNGTLTGEGNSPVNYTMHSHVGGHEEEPETDDEDNSDD